MGRTRYRVGLSLNKKIWYAFRELTKRQAKVPSRVVDKMMLAYLHKYGRPSEGTE